MTKWTLLLLGANQGKLWGTAKAQVFPYPYTALQIWGVSKFASSPTPGPTQNVGPGFQNSLLEVHL